MKKIQLMMLLGFVIVFGVIIGYGQLTTEDKCPEGFEWSEEGQVCLLTTPPTTTPTCPTGYYWNFQYETCAPVEQGPPGWSLIGDYPGGINPMWVLLGLGLFMLLYMRRKGGK